MPRLLTLALFLLFINTTAFGDSATFNIANADQEDTYALTGSRNINSFDSATFQFIGRTVNFGIYTHDAYWRWAITIPRKSIINEAFVEIRASSSNSGVLNAVFYPLLTDDKWETADGFNTVSYPLGSDLNSIAIQGTGVLWANIPNWTLGMWYESPDIAQIVQARIDDLDYNPFDEEDKHFGLTLAYYSGDSFRNGTQEPENDAYTAKLYVDWTPPDPALGCHDPDAVEICYDGIDNNCNDEIDEYCQACPLVDAGDDQTAYVGDVVQLDGSGSTDPEGDFLTHTWSLIERPEGSVAVLSDPIAVRPELEIDRPGDYLVELVVNDGTCDSGIDIVVISTTNSCPVAEAGSDIAAYIGDAVALDGAGSSDADGDALNYSWLIVEIPEGSQAALSDPYDARPSFAIDMRGDYVFELLVDDGLCGSEPDIVTVSTLNLPPVADAGMDLEIIVGEEAQCDGSGSHDPDGDNISHSWCLLSKPLDSMAELSDADTMTPKLMPDMEGDYVVQLVVFDGELSGEPDTCVVKATPNPSSDPYDNCPRTRRYWRKHPEEWPVDSLMLGDETYSKKELLDMMKIHRWKNVRKRMIRQLIATKLNLANGCDPTPIMDTVVAADELLCKSDKKKKRCKWRRHRHSNNKEMRKLRKELSKYNRGLLTPECSD